MASNPLYNQHLHQQMNPVSITPHPNHQRFLPHQHPLHNPQQQHVSRKRPKYSRSKLGCLSCRVRKVKCDETRPICTRCSHSQRECTWPPDVPRPKKGGSSSASDPRPDTSSGDGRNSGSDDAEDASDSGTGPGAIRTSTSAHGRLTGHSRHPSSSSLRGRDLGMTSRTDNGPRDRSPNPFAFNVSQLGPRPSGVGRPANHHHRSYSSSSATSSSSISSLPYPLVPTLRPTSVPGLSASPTHTPASALSGPHLFPSQYAHSPGLWSSADSLNSSRPSTSSSSLAAGLGGIDLNNSFGFTPVTSPIERSTFAGGDNFSFSSSFDAPSNFHQNYDMMAFGGSFDQNIPISFDPSSTIPEFDPASSFIAQLQGMDRPGSRGNYTTSLSNSSMSGSSSSGSPIDGSTSVKMEFEPVRFGEYGGGGGRGEHTNELMSGFREAQTPMPAAGFGLTRSTPQEISINSALGSSDLSALQSHQHPTFSEMGLGDPTTLENINISTSQYLQPQGITSPGMTMATSADTKFGSTWARTHQPHHLSDNSEVRPATTGLGSQLSASLFQMGTVSPEAGAEAERYFIPGVRAGALEVEDRVTSQSPMEMREMMRVENGVQGALEGLEESGLGLFQSAEGLRSGGAEMEPLLLDTHSDSPQRTLEILEDGQASPRSQRSQASALPSLMLVQHNRSRSDTITPRNVRQLSSDALSLAKWNTQDLAGFGLVKEDEADYDSMRGVTVSAGQWGTLSPTTRLMLENPDPLEPFFNTVQERNLVRSESLVVVRPV
ncbi:hypothetical protein FRB95_007320 [Tulasnella sp. JGI-2019a]|nr:hypothetical protein FRB95_007320 [Tulasnella sp. JGI-2019a]